MRKDEEMKSLNRIIGLVTIGILTASFPVLAGETSKDISFRNIPWYSSKAEAEQMLEGEGAISRDDAWGNYARRLSGIEFLSTMTGKDYVDGGGIARKYSGLSVAGYDPSEVGACYVYEINEDGSLNRDADTAEFYFGWYAFDSRDYVDGIAVYDDFLQKLTSVYGDGLSNDESKYFTTTDWVDPNGNQIRLLLGGKSNESYYVSIGYITADADAKLDSVQEVLDAEAAEAEAAEREANKENVDGL